MNPGAALMLAVGISRGAPPLAVLFLGGILVEPTWALFGLSFVVIWARRQQQHETLAAGRRFFERISAELAAGLSLRAALVEGVRTLPEEVGSPIRRRLETGRDLGEIGAELSAALPLAGPSLVAAIGVASHGGGAVGVVFAELGHDLAEEVELLRERQVLTTQARVTAILVGGAPFAFLGYQILTGSLQQRLGNPYGMVLTALGGSLVLIGVFAVSLQSRRIR